MMLDIGGETIVRSHEILGIFDLDTATVMRDSRAYLAAAEKSGDAVTVSAELPKSFVVTLENGGRKVYISPLLTGTLFKRVKPTGKTESRV